MAEQSVAYIYALLDPDTQMPRYIGRTRNMQQRYYNHLYKRERETSEKARWIASLLNNGKKPAMIELEITDEVNMDKRERWWIAYGRAQGWILTNSDDGGRGGRKFKKSTITKLRLSHLGKTRSLESRLKQSVSTKGRKLSDAQIERLRTRPHTWGDKISSGKMGHIHSLSARRKMSEARKRYFDKRGRNVDRAVAYLQSHPDDIEQSCRQLGRHLEMSHHEVAKAKRLLGYEVNRRPKR